MIWIVIIVILTHFRGATIGKVHLLCGGRLSHGRLGKDGALRLQDEVVSVTARLAFSLLDRHLLMQVRDKLVVNVFEGRPAD